MARQQSASSEGEVIGDVALHLHADPECSFPVCRLQMRRFGLKYFWLESCIASEPNRQRSTGETLISVCGKLSTRSNNLMLIWSPLVLLKRLVNVA